MSWISRHRLFSLVLILSIPGLAAAMMSLPEEGEKEIFVEELPNSIQRALADVDVEEVEHSSVYEVEIEEDGVEIELKLDASGRLLGIKIDGGDEDEEEDEGNDENEDEDGEDDDENQDAADEEDSEVVELSSVPDAARAAIKKFAAGNAIELVEKEEKDGHVLFEALWKVDGKEHEATVTSRGVLVELEEATTKGGLPEVVRNITDSKFSGISDLKIERKLIAAYEIEAMIDGKEHKMLVTSTGAEIEFEHDEDEDEE